MLMLLLSILLSCTKPISPGDVSSARAAFDGENNCAMAMKKIMNNSECEQLRYAQLSDLEVMFQCYKPDSKRTDFWDTMVFRISPWSLRHNSLDSAARNHRMICLDEYTVLEAFHPKELGVLVK